MEFSTYILVFKPYLLKLPYYFRDFDILSVFFVLKILNVVRGSVDLLSLWGFFLGSIIIL